MPTIQVDVDVDLCDIDLETLIDNIVYRITKKSRTLTFYEKEAMERLKDAIDEKPSMRKVNVEIETSVQDLLKFDVMKSILDKYTLKEIETALPI